MIERRQKNKKVFVIVGGSVLAGAGFWGQALYGRVSAIEEKLPAIYTNSQQLVDINKRLDRIETKLDRLIERK